MKRILVLLFVVIGIGAPARATTIFYEGFDYSVGGRLPSLSSWSGGYYPDYQPVVSSGSLSYVGLPASTGESAKTRNSAPGTPASGYAKRPFSEVTSNGLYASFIMRVDDLGGLTSSADPGFFGLRNAEDSNVLQLRRNTSNTNQFDVGIAGTANADIGWVSGLAINTDHFIVVGNDDVTDFANGAFELWVNLAPDDLGGTPPLPDASASWRTGNLSALILGTSNSGGLLADVYFDELRVGTTFQDVTPPDPIPYSTLFLLD